ncbi:MAG: hypothetical protein IJF32_11375, partial [Oscillospiraceae bacterium]|nr:hypothetical protein [Oscillospiraceae bacterium]
SDAQALDEIAADFTKNIVNDVKMFERLAQDNRTVAMKLMDSIKEFITKVKSTFSGDRAKADTAAQEKYGAKVSELEAAVAQFEKMLSVTETAVASGNINTAGTDAGGGRMYDLKAFEDGKRFVDVQTDQHLFDGLTENEKGRMATKIIKERFSGKVVGRDNRVFVNGRSAAEYGHPAKRISGLEYDAKMRASTELDNLIDAGTNFRTAPDGADGHIHPEATGDFKYFDTIFKVGNEYFEGRINILPNEKGDLLTDITQIKNITQDISSSYGQNPKSTFLRDNSEDINSSNDIIPETPPKVNRENSLKTADLLSPDYGKVGGRDSSTALRMTDGRENTSSTAGGPPSPQGEGSGKSYIEETGLDTYFNDMEERAQVTEGEKVKAVYKKQREKELRGQIMRTTKKLDQTLRNPTDKKHILKELQKPVANLLRAINLEGMSLEYGTDAKYHRVESDSPYGEPTNRTQAFRELKKIYERIGGEDSTITISPELLEGDPEGRGKLFEKIIEMQDIPLYAMSEEQLRTVWKALRAVENSVRTANKMFTSKRGETVEKVAKSIRDGAKMKNTRVDIVGLSKLKKLITLDTMTPEEFFHRLGPGGDAVFRMLRNAQDKKTLLLERAIDFSSKLVADEKISKLEKTTHKVTLGGEKIELSTAQLMELYALTRREQATEHIFKGGIKPEELPGIKKLIRSSVVRHITQQEVGTALDKLSSEEKRIAERLSDFTSSVLGAEMNEACLNVFGYEKFGEKNYWPIRTVETSLKTDEKQVGGKKGAPSIRNFGMANATTPKAKTPLKIGSVFDTFTSHTAEATTYAAYLEATEDLRRILNYTFFDDEGEVADTMKEVVEKTFGKDGLQYWLNLDENISGGMSGDDGGFFDTVLRNTKAARIAGNIRVIAQQPTAVLRAGSMIDYKYILEGMAHPKRGWERAVKYAPIAKWKSYGFFDSNTGPRMKDLLFNQSSALEKVRDLGMKGIEVADAFGWGALWSACEAEIEAKIKNAKKAEKKKTPVRTGVNALLEEDSFRGKIDGWNDLTDGTRIKVGTIKEGSALNQVGLPTSGLFFDVGKIKKAMSEHSDHLSEDVLKKIPELLQNPIVITEYTGAVNTVNVYGELFVKGRPVVVGLVMRPDVSGKNIITAVRTIHMRSNAAKQITDTTVLYLNENKERTRSWFQVCGNLNVPLDGTQYGLIRSISYADGSVNIQKSDEVYADMQPGTQGFYDAVAKRFTEIVDHTQVVDGVLQRSQIMRSSNAINKMATSYMAESTKNVNMFVSALRDFAQTEKGEARQEAGQRLLRTSISLIVSFAVNAALGQSFIDALRDDEKEKKYWERWLEKFKGNMVDAVNPLQYFPYIKDVVSLMQGYSVERMDMDGIENIIEAGKNLVASFSGDSKLSTAGTLNNMCAVVGTMFGFGTANVKRDVRAAAREVAAATDSYVVEYLMAKATYSIKYEKNRGDFYDILRRAYENDKEAYNIIYSDMRKNGFKKDDIEEKMKTQTMSGKFQDAVNAAKKTKEAKNAVPADKIVYRHLNREKNAIRGTSAADQNTILDNIPKYRSNVEKYLKKYPGKNEDKKLEYAYREANRALYGEEYAIRVNGGSDVHKKAEEKVKRGKTTWEKYYDEYFGKTDRRFEAISDRFGISYTDFEKIENAISKNSSKADEIAAIQKLGYKNSIARRIYTLYHDTE